MAERTLTANALKHFRTLLAERRAETLVHLAALEDDLGVARQARAEGSADDEHDPDGPTMSQAWSQLSGQIVDVNGGQYMP